MVASDILKGLGYECEVVRVEAIIGKEIYRSLVKEQKDQGIKPRDINFENIFGKGGYSIGLGIVREREDIHYVIWFPKSRQIMDLTFEQVSRPQHNIIRHSPYQLRIRVPLTCP